MIISDYKQGDVFSNQDLMDTFNVSNAGGMRRSLVNNCLVLINKSDSVYQDRWENDVIYYTGMGLQGDQSIHVAQNKTLANSRSNGIQILFFNSTKVNEYIYIGEVELVDEPFYEIQKDTQGKQRRVVIFSLKLK